MISLSELTELLYRIEKKTWINWNVFVESSFSMENFVRTSNYKQQAFKM